MMAAVAAQELRRMAFETMSRWILQDEASPMPPPSVYIVSKTKSPANAADAADYFGSARRVHRETGDAGEPCAFPMGRCRQLPGRSSSRRLWRDVPVIPSAADRQTSAAKVFSPPPSVRSGGLGIHLEFMVPPPPDWNWLSATLFPAAKRWRNACPERAWSRLSTPTVTRISPTPVTRMAEG